MHSLLERLPDVAMEERETRGTAWLAHQARDFAETDRREMLDKALAVIGQPEWAELFGPNALAEVPLAALDVSTETSSFADPFLKTFHLSLKFFDHRS